MRCLLLQCLGLHLAFIYFDLPNRVCVFFSPNSRLVLGPPTMHSFHKFHIRYEPDPKTCGRCN